MRRSREQFRAEAARQRQLATRRVYDDAARADFLRTAEQYDVCAVSAPSEESMIADITSAVAFQAGVVADAWRHGEDPHATAKLGLIELVARMRAAQDGDSARWWMVHLCGATPPPVDDAGQGRLRNPDTPPDAEGRG